MIDYLVVHTWHQHSDAPVSADPNQPIAIPSRTRFVEITAFSTVQFRFDNKANSGSRVIGANETRIIQVPPSAQTLNFSTASQVIINWGS